MSKPLLRGYAEPGPGPTTREVFQSIMNAGNSIRREISELEARQAGADKPVAHLLANLSEAAEHCEKHFYG